MAVSDLVTIARNRATVAFSFTAEKSGHRWTRPAAALHALGRCVLGGGLLRK
jgi:hypothetical protein